MGFRTALTLVASLAAAPLVGCDDNADTASSTAAPADDGPKKPVGRSYQNPESALTKQERSDILMICDALVDVDLKHMSKADEKGFYSKLPQRATGESWSSTDCRRKKEGRPRQPGLAQEDRQGPGRCRRFSPSTAGTSDGRAECTGD